MTAGIDVERHDGIDFRRIANESVVDIDLSTEIKCAIRHGILCAHGSVRFDLREVFLINGVGDIGDGQQRDRHIRNDTI